jgi:predicted nucleic acid-binding protein
MSALALAEARRVVVRARVSGRLSVELERAAFAELQILVADCTLIDVSSAVLERAGRLFPVEPVRTLDAIHLATVELLGEAPQLVTIVTRDRRIRDNAVALGFAVE